ncbi:MULTISPECIES: TonB-dependent receptor [unclassified Flavobacterium]|jgi:outer membrane receptor protein involved in Fe transport|uniref:TonB-dependent receptor n=1 Tax=unclassified Flavobacterium TaxID=196869 RepID=UPI0025BF31A2|nr:MULTISPECIES: TonB-dependent receptor [unclassified Flavobacterium]
MKLNTRNFYIQTTPFPLGRSRWLSGGVGILLLFVQFSFAQKKEENIGTEVVNVVKPYTPTISDAFKVKETPVLDDEGNTKKEIIKYTIFSFPVASTFTPSKGKAEGVEKEEQAHLFKNYATFGGGNYGIVNAELFVNQDLDNNSYVGGMFRHLSSQGSIKGVELSNKFYDTSIDLTYGIHEKNLSWNVDLGYQNQIYNWYGLPTGFGSALTPNDRANLIAGINPQQSYNTIYLGSKIEFNESFLKEASVKFDHFSDAYGSSENRFYVKPSFQFDVDDKEIKTNVIVDYLGGSFKKDYWNTNTNPIKYGYTNIGIAPSFVMNQDDWTVHLGAGLFYSIDNQNSSNKFYVYPQINASYKVVGDLMIFYAGAEGNLGQNSYSDFVNLNPFLSPTLNIVPTDKQYDIFAGLKGKIINNVSYNIRGSYVNERNKALFKSNDYSEINPSENYTFGNSMQVVYDDMKTLSFYGELKADFSKEVTFGINGTFSSYTNKNEAKPWNLPAIKLSSTLDFNITSKWYAGINVFYVGERKDLKINMDIISIVPIVNTPITLDSYFDVNAHLGFRYSDRLTAFLRANNITNKTYEKWLNYPVQGFQVVLGANYKFDF